MVAATLSSFVLLAILSSFLFIGRTGVNAYNYVGMEHDARLGLERFSEDVRMASNVTWGSATSVTLTIPQATGSGTDTVVYSYDSTSTSLTYKCFLRQGPDPITGTSRTAPLIRGVQSFEFDRWMLGSTGRATNDLETKQLQIRLTISTISNVSTSVVTATNLVVSARYILRNKS